MIVCATLACSLMGDMLACKLCYSFRHMPCILQDQASMVPVFWTGLAIWLLFAVAPLRMVLGLVPWRRSTVTGGLSYSETLGSGLRQGLDDHYVAEVGRVTWMGWVGRRRKDDWMRGRGPLHMRRPAAAVGMYGPQHDCIAPRPRPSRLRCSCRPAAAPTTGAK